MSVFYPAAIALINAINALLEILFDVGSELTSTFGITFGTVFNLCFKVQTNVVLPLAYCILTLFILIEIFEVTTKSASHGGSEMEMLGRVVLRFVICKTIIDNLDTGLKVVYQITVLLSKQIAALIGTSDGTISTINTADIVKSNNVGENFLLMCVALGCLVIVAITLLRIRILIYTRFLDLYLNYAFAPIPFATLANEEWGQVGKSFFKSFFALCLQGTLLYMVILIFPTIINSVIATTEASTLSVKFAGFSLTASCMGLSQMINVMLICFVLQTAVSGVGKLANTICNAM